MCVVHLSLGLVELRPLLFIGRPEHFESHPPPFPVSVIDHVCLFHLCFSVHFAFNMASGRQEEDISHWHDMDDDGDDDDAVRRLPVLTHEVSRPPEHFLRS